MFSFIFVANLSITCQSTNHHYQMFFSWNRQVLFCASLIFFSSSYLMFHQWNKPSTIEVEQIQLLKIDNQVSPTSKVERQSVRALPIVLEQYSIIILRVLYPINHEIEKEEWQWLQFDPEYLQSSFHKFIHRHVIVTDMQYLHSFKRQIQRRNNVQVITVVIFTFCYLRTMNIETLSWNCQKLRSSHISFNGMNTLIHSI